MEVRNVRLDLSSPELTDPETHIATLSQALSKAGIIRGEAQTIIGNGFVVVLEKTPLMGKLNEEDLVVRLNDGSDFEYSGRPEVCLFDPDQGTMIVDF